MIPIPRSSPKKRKAVPPPANKSNNDNTQTQEKGKDRGEGKGDGKGKGMSCSQIPPSVTGTQTQTQTQTKTQNALDHDLCESKHSDGNDRIESMKRDTLHASDSSSSPSSNLTKTKTKTKTKTITNTSTNTNTNTNTKNNTKRKANMSYHSDCGTGSDVNSNSNSNSINFNRLSSLFSLLNTNLTFLSNNNNNSTNANKNTNNNNGTNSDVVSINSFESVKKIVDASIVNNQDKLTTTDVGSMALIMPSLFTLSWINAASLSDGSVLELSMNPSSSSSSSPYIYSNSPMLNHSSSFSSISSSRSNSSQIMDNNDLILTIQFNDTKPKNFKPYAGSPVVAKSKEKKSTKTKLNKGSLVQQALKSSTSIPSLIKLIESRNLLFSQALQNFKEKNQVKPHFTCSIIFFFLIACIKLEYVS
jgi:hypothetical protein